jgi:hypothetical protein
MPLNPIGRTGLCGRGSLLYWGPNNCIFNELQDQILIILFILILKVLKQ